MTAIRFVRFCAWVGASYSSGELTRLILIYPDYYRFPWLQRGTELALVGLGWAIISWAIWSAPLPGCRRGR